MMIFLLAYGGTYDGAGGVPERPWKMELGMEGVGLRDTSPLHRLQNQIVGLVKLLALFSVLCAGTLIITGGIQDIGLGRGYGFWCCWSTMNAPVRQDRSSRGPPSVCIRLFSGCRPHGTYFPPTAGEAIRLAP